MLQVKSNGHYSNIIMLGNEGEQLTSVSERKADWFLRKGLAKEITPPEGFKRAIQLIFNHKKVQSPEWASMAIPNQCTVCGCQEDLTLHHVIPYVFRREMPPEHKDHSREWCLLLCLKHHIEAETMLFEVYGKFLPQVCTSDSQKDASGTLIRLKAENRLPLLPPDRIEWLLQHSGYKTIGEVPQISLSELKTFRDQRSRELSLQHRACISQWAQQFIISNGGIPGVKNLFRQTFLQLNPQFIPKGYLELP